MLGKIPLFLLEVEVFWYSLCVSLELFQIFRSCLWEWILLWISFLVFLISVDFFFGVSIMFIPNFLLFSIVVDGGELLDGLVFFFWAFL